MSLRVDRDDGPRLEAGSGRDPSEGRGPFVGSREIERESLERLEVESDRRAELERGLETWDQRSLGGGPRGEAPSGRRRSPSAASPEGRRNADGDATVADEVPSSGGGPLPAADRRDATLSYDHLPSRHVAPVTRDWDAPREVAPAPGGGLAPESEEAVGDDRRASGSTLETSADRSRRLLERAGSSAAATALASEMIAAASAGSLSAAPSDGSTIGAGALPLGEVSLSPAAVLATRGAASSGLAAGLLSLQGGRRLEARTLSDEVAEDSRLASMEAARVALAGGPAGAVVVGALAEGSGSADVRAAYGLARTAAAVRGLALGARGAETGTPRPTLRSAIKSAWQHRRSQQVSRSIAAARSTGAVVTGQGAATRLSTTLGAVMRTRLVTASGGGWAATTLGAALLSLLPLALVLILVIGAAMAATGSAQQEIVGLGPNATAMVNYLREAGWDDVHIAAAVGNSAVESGGTVDPVEIDPAHEGDLSGVANYDYEVNCGIYSWTDTSPGSGQMTKVKNYAAQRGKPWQDLDVQLDFFLEVYLPSRGAATDRWFAISDLEDCTRVMVSPTGGILSGWQGAIEGSVWQMRITAATNVYNALTNPSYGTGQDYASASEAQKAIVDAAYRTGSPGAGLCAAWVSNVYQNAGIGWFAGHACDMYYSYCHSTDRSQLKVGMLVAVASSSSGTSAGARYGHVGIYIGDGKVMHNIGPIVVSDLDDWIATYCKWSPVGWGFGPGI